ncbi:hypothetical protein OOK31_04255 [Streptomyces sp. NBC_00249]|uniref:hypothetical protein n=1 Tax=Streptomyces sp. NBC_00249 TaxID=2975690 RepID=UPI002257DD07|nr:hypothetical protein [Streptomyces sp. NBC_00249]MCX5193110.1 hypothetical protein [Streptomyces sp. NBC_00249]
MARHDRPTKAISIAVWWPALTLLLWCGGQVRHQPASAVTCAASAALLVALGEIGAWLRRRWRARSRLPRQH